MDAVGQIRENLASGGAGMDEILLDWTLHYFYVPGAQARHVSLDKDGGRAETGIPCAMAGKHAGSMWCGAINCSNSKSKCPDLSLYGFPKIMKSNCRFVSV